MLYTFEGFPEIRHTFIFLSNKRSLVFGTQVKSPRLQDPQLMIKNKIKIRMSFLSFIVTMFGASFILDTKVLCPDVIAGR